MSGRERLEIEDDEGRAARLGSLFSSISAPPVEQEIPAFPQPPSRPFAMPQSDILARARAFLPLMAASNADLLSRAAADPSSVVIENPSSNPNSETGAGTGNIVAMDVGLGVFDVRGEVGGDVGPVVERDAEVWAAAQKASEEEDAEEGDEDEDDSSSSSSSSSDDEDEDQGATQPPATGQPKVVPL